MTQSKTTLCIVTSWTLMKFWEDLSTSNFAFDVFRHAVESSTPSFSFFTLTVWNAYQKRETYLKPHANLYVNRHFLTTLKILGNFLCICYFVTLFWFVFQTGSRYDAQVAVFGSEFQKKLSEQKYFIVSGLEAWLQIFHLAQSLRKGTGFMPGFSFADW